MFFSVFTSNASPNGILGIMFKDVEFHGTNHFISNRGSSIRVNYTCVYYIIAVYFHYFVYRQQIQILQYMEMLISHIIRLNFFMVQYEYKILYSFNCIVGLK